MPVLSSRAQRTRIHTCNTCGQKPTWKNIGSSHRWKAHYVATCACGSRDLGEGPQFLAIEDWNIQNP